MYISFCKEKRDLMEISMNSPHYSIDALEKKYSHILNDSVYALNYVCPLHVFRLASNDVHIGDIACLIRHNDEESS